METEAARPRAASALPSETSLEGWKQGFDRRNASFEQSFRNFLRGMETEVTRFQGIRPSDFRNFLRGMETNARDTIAKVLDASETSLEGWKPVPPVAWQRYVYLPKLP